MPDENLKILTYNAGLFRIRVFGRTLVAPAPHIEERFAALAPALLSSGADIIALQEVYDLEHRVSLIASLERAYPYRAAWPERRWGRMCSGLMLFSKYPIAAAQPHSFRDLPFDERLAVEKGMLSAEIDVGRFGRIGVTNCHHTSGGALWDPEGRLADRLRSRQYRQLFAMLSSTAPTRHLAIGDFNAGPEASGENYRELIASGYADAWAERHGSRSEPTWDPANPLNAKGPHRATSAQRLDHVLLSPGLAQAARVAGAKIVFEQPCVELSGHPPVTVSDHYGLMVELEANRP